MSRQLAIINSSNVYAMNIFKNLRGFDRIKFGDIFNSRKHVSIINCILIIVPLHI